MRGVGAASKECGWCIELPWCWAALWDPGDITGALVGGGPKGVWDDPPLEPALTSLRWVGELKPTLLVKTQVLSIKWWDNGLLFYRNTRVRNLHSRVINDFGVSQREPPGAMRPEILSKLPSLGSFPHQCNHVPFQEAQLVVTTRQISVERLRQRYVPLWSLRWQSHGLWSTLRAVHIWRTKI